jgi:precorrin-6Y C5,15-methyltransferase (decarboxylating)
VPRHRRFLIGKLGADAIDVLPAVSTLQLAFARLKLAGRREDRLGAQRRCGEWAPAPRPATASTPSCAAAGHALIGVFTSPANSPDRIARALIAAGHGDDFRSRWRPAWACPTSAWSPTCRWPRPPRRFPTRTSSC